MVDIKLYFINKTLPVGDRFYSLAYILLIKFTWNSLWLILKKLGMEKIKNNQLNDRYLAK